MALTNWFANWQSDNPKKRLRALSSLSEDKLLQLALHDSDQKVRLKAISKLTKPQSLLTLVNQSLNQQEQKQALPRFARLLIYSDQISDFQREQLLLDCKNEQALFTLLQQDDCPASLSGLALYGIQDQQLLLNLLKNRNAKMLTLSIIEKIDQPDLLLKALTLCKHNGQYFNAVKAKLDQQKNANAKQ